MLSDMALHPITAISICTGVGMLDHGVEAALRLCGKTLVPLLYVEREAFAAANLVWQMEEGFLAQAPIWSDVRTCAGPDCGDVVSSEPPGIIFGGIPCQPHSTAGKHRRAEDDRDLWDATRRAVEAYKPSLVFIENVSGFLTGPDDGASVVCKDLESMGYRTTVGLFSSAECGASHGRLRCFVLANRTGQSFFRETTASEPSGEGGTDVAGGSEAVADAGARGCGEYREEASGKATGHAAVGVQGLPRYAPPQNGRPWATVANAQPDWLPAASRAEIESQFLGVVDGMATRTHRLRAIGNGVDPLVAAYAFLTLSACL